MERAMTSSTARQQLTIFTQASPGLLALASLLLWAAVPAKAQVVINHNPPVSLSLASGHQGETVTVQITGTGTYFDQSFTQASFGPGISVGGAPEGQLGPVTVISPTLASASVVISPSTHGGSRTVIVNTHLPPFVQSSSASFTVQISSPFHIQSYQVGQPLPGGKCLDYGPPRPDTGATVFLNDCAAAHPVLVREINDQRDVILYAGSRTNGSQVIGIHNPVQIDPSFASAAMYSLELQNPLNLNEVGFNNQVFSFDGDSIILASSRPCTNTDFNVCPPPPPQLVVQIQNARGATDSLLVAAPRNLSDNEFWDFIAADGSGGDPTSGFVHVATNGNLWNAICASPPATCDPNGNCTPPPNTDPTRPGPSAPCDTFKAGWGSVIVITSPIRCDNVRGDQPDVGFCIDMSKYAPLVLPAGVTLRGGGGGRRRTNFGPQLYAAWDFEKTNYSTGNIPNCDWCMIQVHGDYVRITGLRLRGPSRSTAPVDSKTAAINIDAVGPRNFFEVATTIQFIAMIDHNDISDWESSAVGVTGPYHMNSGTNPYTCMGTVNGQDFSQKPCACIIDLPDGKKIGVRHDPATADNVRIERNFLHHNTRWGAGYGAGTGTGGRAAISGNTFLTNRHAIASDGEPHSEYRAWYNLVLSFVHNYGLSKGEWQQDFDMHGTGSGGYGWTGGYRVDIAGNTFLGRDRYNFELRGHPCSTDFFRDNVTQEEQVDGKGVINFHNIGDPGVPRQSLGSNVPHTPVDVASDPRISQVIDSDNQFGNSSPHYADPTFRLGVGDFDGDGVQDLFLATGTAWYYSPAGAAEWRFLSAKTDKIEALLFGDFDGDGRTDVAAIQGGQLVVSWGGISDWEVLNKCSATCPANITDTAVGKFLDHAVGDHRDDIFFADGKTWFLSSGGSEDFTPVNNSDKHVSDLRFGDFDGDGKTDVFGVVLFGPNDWRWAFSKSAQGFWADGVLRPAMSDNDGNPTPVHNLVVADFDGDGYADVATSLGGSDWIVSYNGRGDWTHFNLASTRECHIPDFYLAIGRFAGNAGADVLIWNDRGGRGRGLCIVKGGAIPAANPWTAGRQRWSRQDMR
jgi:hypothetical protein